MKILDSYQNILTNSKTKYFIIDSGNHVDDRDFQTYTWHKSKNNKMQFGDLFIYRKPQKISENGQFYLYGCGQIGRITGEDRVKAQLTNTFQFINPLFQKDLNQFNWEWNTKGETWEHFWGQYGINQITKQDFINLIKLVDDLKYEVGISDEIINEEIEIENQNYFVSDTEAFTKTRPWQAAWSKNIKEDYGYRCAVCNITTTTLLVGSHIIPVSDDKNNRKNPRNGICLCVLHDKAFDKGLITINNEHELLLSPRLSNDPVLHSALKEYEGKKVHLPNKFPPSLEFLEFHNNNVFLR